MNNNLDINQTQFASQEPVMEDAVSYQEPVSEEIQAAQSKKKKNKLIVIGIIGFILIVVFVLLLVLISALSPTQQVTTDQLDDVIETPQGELDPLLEEVYLLSDDLENADPSLDTIPFPPVDMELRLEEAQRR